MPFKPASPCVEPRCPRRATYRGRCAAHNGVRNRARGREQSLIYDWDWKRLRAEVLRERSVCQAPGCRAPATQVDHRVSVRQAPQLRLVKSNLVAMCASHHSKKTAAVDGSFGR